LTGRVAVYRVTTSRGIRMPYKESDSGRKWREKNKDRLREYNREFRAKNRTEYNRKEAARHRRLMRAARRKVVALLGGKCKRCGFDDERAFQIHHRKGDGGRHRAGKGYTVSYYNALLKMMAADADAVELLCANCHAIEHWVPDEQT